MQFHVSKAMICGDWPWVCGWLAAQFGRDLPIEWVESTGKVGAKFALGSVFRDGHCATDGTLAVWWKSRIGESFSWPVGCTGEETPYGTGTHFNFFFVSLEESELMLWLLRKNNWEVIPPSVATSGIERVQHEINPVDRVAHRVTRKK